MTDHSEDVYYCLVYCPRRDVDDGEEFGGIFGNSPEQRESLEKTVRDFCEEKSRSLKLKTDNSILDQPFVKREDRNELEDLSLVDEDDEVVLVITKAADVDQHVTNALNQSIPRSLYLCRIISFPPDYVEDPFPKEVEDMWDDVIPYITPGHDEFLFGRLLATCVSMTDAEAHALAECQKRTDPKNGKDSWILNMDDRFWLSATTEEGRLRHIIVVGKWRRRRATGKWVHGKMR
ncbi:uncharacterized protein J4E88_010486 [Alternaria novae-zelandiae]|uniref:uncharacterized protein n=1 Tax=Alternaria novae-zelandiae TaxID=430562 RepID=UPI0020C506A3|nr:uncharacterized protein J4E88_010486 [Alternaria novae-zelandiae]KAI4666191.1 hypothetical protein J4E88_010486 [Alternaria novae-zelandiae]